MTPEQAALLKKARESLNAAGILAGQSYWDFAASRAYYAMFYVAEAFLLGEGLTFSKHSGVIAAFGQHFAKTGRVPLEFHRFLIEAEALRNVGDYDIGPGLTAEETQPLIERAEQFLALAESRIGPVPPNGVART